MTMLFWNQFIFVNKCFVIWIMNTGHNKLWKYILFDKRKFQIFILIDPPKCCCWGFEAVLRVQLDVSDPPKTPCIPPCSQLSPSRTRETLSLYFVFMFVFINNGSITISTSTTRCSISMIPKSLMWSPQVLRYQLSNITVLWYGL